VPELTAVEAEGLRLVAALDAARRAWADFVPPPSPCVEIVLGADVWAVEDLVCPEIAAVWVWEYHLRALAMDDAWEELELFVLRHGEVEHPGGGLFVIGADGHLAYRSPRYIPYRLAKGGASCN
jgi:hypothetical protein